MADAAASTLARPRTLPARRDAAVAIGAALAIATLAAADGGYFPTSWGWGALVTLWLVAAVLLLGAIVRPSGLQLAFLGGIAGLAAWTLLSAVWSTDTVDSALEAQRMLLYLAAAAALVLVVNRAAVSPALGGVLAGIALAAGYGLATRLFPDRLGAFDVVAEYRLSEPLGYWNALGVFAAMGIVLALGFAARGGTVAVRALAGVVPVFLLPAVYFTFGRGPWIALGLAVLAAIALDARRLQLLGVLFAVGTPAALGLLAATRYEALRREDAPLALAADQGERLALILVALALLAAAAAAAYALLERRIEVPPRARLGFAAAVGLLAVALFVALFVRAGDPVSLIDRAYDSFTSPPPRIEGDVGERLFSFSGSYRAELWESAWDGYLDHPVTGLGAGAYEQQWLETRPFEHKVRDAHNLYLETLAELGPVGLALLLLALGAPLVAAIAARRHPLASAAFAAYIAYLVHAGVDWDWELPAVTVAALVCSAALLAAARREERTLDPSPVVRGVGVALTLALAVVAFVTLTGNNAIAASDGAAGEERWAEAADEARTAKRWAPWSSEPWQRLGEAHLGQGDFAAAENDFRKAIEKEPRDFELWLGLAQATDGAERAAALRRATELNPYSPEIEEFRAG
jgi:cytochrome c-type biogenesis protein CcmH/NrfG